MTKLTTPTQRLVKMGTVIGLAVVCLTLLVGLGLNGALEAQAGAVENVSADVMTTWRPQIGTMATTGTASTVGLADFTGSAVFGSAGGFIDVAGTARVTTTIQLTTDSATPISVTVTGSIPVTVTEPLYSIDVDNGSFASGFTEIYGTVPVNIETEVGPAGANLEIVETISISGRLGVNNVSPPAVVTATGSGPLSGSAGLVVTESHSGRFSYLPIVLKDPVPEGFFDDFSSYASGIWPQGSGGYCEVAYSSGHYRMKVKDGWDGSAMKCVVITRSPAFQEIGTIGVRARRTSDEDYELWYGMYFSVGADYTEDRWAVEVRPDELLCDGSERPYLWLNCIEDEEACWDNKYKCTNDINIEQNEWNDIDVTRDGDLAVVYINSDDQISKTSGALDDEGYFNLFVYSEDNDHDIVVEFDDFYAVPQVLDID